MQQPDFFVVKDNEALFAAGDRIFLGEGLIETLKVVDGKPAYAKAHWKRLQAAIDFLSLNVQLPYAFWHDCLMQCIAENALRSGGIKVILSGGTAARGLLQSGEAHRLVMQGFTYTPISKPVSLIRAPWQRDAANPLYQLKSINYLEAVQASRYAQKHGYDDVLFSNTNGLVTETSVANLFIVKAEAILTPPVTDGVLAGVMRQKLLDASSLGELPIIEQSLTYADILSAQAVFICNALQGVIPVHRFEHTAFDCVTQPLDLHVID